MRSSVITNGRIEPTSCGDCRVDCLPVYEPGCESTGPICPGQECPTDQCYTFRARDALRVQPHEVERLFAFRSACVEESNEWVRRSLAIRLRRVQSCHWQWDMCALSITGNGLIRFRWPNGFLKAPPGYYEGELLVNGEMSQKIWLHKPFMISNIHATEPVMQPCHDECGPWERECCLPPLIEQECYQPEPAECGGCDDRC